MADIIESKRKELESLKSDVWQDSHLSNMINAKLEGFNLGVSYIKCDFCGRDNCLNILCHADLEVIKQESKKEAQKEFLDKVELYFHKCWIGRKVPKLEELKQSLEVKDD